MKTLAQLNEEVWQEYEKTKKPVCQYLVRNGYKIIQCEYNGTNGTTYVHLEDDLHTDIVINGQACGNTIYVTKVTDKVIKFLFDEIFVTDPDSLGAYYIIGEDGVDDDLESFLEKTRRYKMNKLYEKIMNGENVGKKTMNKLCDWIDSNINDGYLTEDDAKVEKYEKIKNDLNEYVGYLWR